jgi:hypothetical protein
MIQTRQTVAEDMLRPNKMELHSIAPDSFRGRVVKVVDFKIQITCFSPLLVGMPMLTLDSFS